MNKNKKNKKSKKARHASEINEAKNALLRDIAAQGRDPAETICEKARRVAREDGAKKLKEREKREEEFLRKMFEVNDLRAAGIIADKVRDDGTIEWMICGYRWEIKRGCFGNNSYYLDSLNESNTNLYAYTLAEFGNALERLDKKKANTPPPPPIPPSDPVFVEETEFKDTSGQSFWQRIRNAIWGD